MVQVLSCGWRNVHPIDAYRRGATRPDRSIPYGRVPAQRHSCQRTANVEQFTTDDQGFFSPACCGIAQANTADVRARPSLCRVRHRVRLPAVQLSLCRMSVVHVAGEQVTITLVTPRVEPAVGHGILDRTIRFVRVSAVRKAALADEGANVAVVAGHFLTHHVPQLKLANARRVDDVTAAGQRQQVGPWSWCAVPFVSLR